jgi:hypothetical protein
MRERFARRWMASTLDISVPLMVASAPMASRDSRLWPWTNDREPRRAVGKSTFLPLRLSLLCRRTVQQLFLDTALSLGLSEEPVAERDKGWLFPTYRPVF